MNNHDDMVDAFRYAMLCRPPRKQSWYKRFCKWISWKILNFLGYTTDDVVLVEKYYQDRLKQQVAMDIAIKDLRQKHPEITDKDLERIFEIITH